MRQVDGTHRPADALCQPAWRPGRTGFRRRQLSPSTPTRSARLPDEPVRGGRVVLTTWKRERGRLDLRKGLMSPLPEKEEADYRACMIGFKRLCQQERLQERRARPVRRHRFGDLRGHCRRRAGRGACAHRHAALSLHIDGFAGGCRGLRQGAWARHTTSCAIEEPVHRFPDGPCRHVRRHGGGHHRGKPAEPRAAAQS